MNYTLRNLLVAAVLMMLGVFLVTSFIRSERRELSRGKQEVQVFVAAKDIPAGTPAKELEEGGYLETKDVLREDAPPNPVGKMSTIEKLVSNETIYKGEVVSYTAFDNSAGLKPTAQINGNERLFSVPINAAGNVGGLVRPGDHIDLFASFQLQGGTGSFTKSSIIARDVEVIETPDSLKPESAEEQDAEAPKADGDKQLYVLKATDREMADILFALSAADDFKLQMILRPANGDSETDIDTITGPLPPRFDESNLPALKGNPGTDQPGPNPTVR